MRLLFVLLNIILVAAQCDTYGTCSECVAPTTAGACGWCADTSSCLAGDSTGDFNGICNNRNWIYGGESKLLSTTSGFPVNPSKFNVYLYPDSELKLIVVVTNPITDAVPLDLYIIEDLSGSMADDVATFQELSRELVVDVLRYQSNPRFGIGSFIEKPILPFGKPDNDDGTNTFTWPLPANANFDNDALTKCPNRTATSGPWNWAFCHESDISTNYNLLTTAVNSFVNHVNEDWPENQLESLLFASVCDMGWREDARRVVLIATDADYQVPVPIGGTIIDASGQTQNVPFVEDHPGTCTQRRGTNNIPGTYYNYPDPDMVKQKVAAANIVPIIASANVPPEHRDNPTWVKLLNSWGFGSVLELASDSSNLIELIRQALEEVATSMTMVKNVDDNNQVLKFNPVDGYPDVAAGDQRYFEITLLDSAGIIETDSIFFSVIGFGDIEITVTDQIPCLGCDGGSDPSVVVDLCGECKGQNDCVGCDWIPYSNANYDGCGVCDGDGTSCIDCKRVPWGDAKIDACLICDGDNTTCTGCDGVVYPVDLGETPPTNDNCGVCNGNDSCRGCDGILNSNKTVDVCGVCGGDNLTCVVIPPPPPSKLPAIVGLAAGGAVLLALIVIAVIFIVGLLAKKKWDEYQYMQNQGITSLGTSPMYEESGGWQKNALE